MTTYWDTEGHVEKFDVQILGCCGYGGDDLGMDICYYKVQKVVQLPCKVLWQCLPLINPNS